MMLMAWVPASMLAQMVRGNGDVRREVRKVSKFKGVDVGSAFEVRLEKGSQEVVLKADENVLRHIKTEVHKGVLKVYLNKDIGKTTVLNLTISMPELNYLNVHGAADLKGDDTFSSEKLHIEASGASSIDIAAKVEALVCNISGASDVKIEGRADEIGISASGASEFDGDDMKAEHGKVMASGSSSVEVHLTSSIHVHATGASSVSCDGSPDEKDVQVSGAADVDVD